MIKYIGSKRTLVPLIRAAVAELPVRTACDLFAGTTRVGQALRMLGLEVVSNDLIPPGQMAPGTAGERVVIIQPRGPGHAKLCLELKRSWEHDLVEQFEADVHVTGS